MKFFVTILLLSLFVGQARAYDNAVFSRTKAVEIKTSRPLSVNDLIAIETKCSTQAFKDLYAQIDSKDSVWLTTSFKGPSIDLNADDSIFTFFSFTEAYLSGYGSHGFFADVASSGSQLTVSGVPNFDLNLEDQTELSSSNAPTLAILGYLSDLAYDANGNLKSYKLNIQKIYLLGNAETLFMSNDKTGKVTTRFIDGAALYNCYQTELTK